MRNISPANQAALEQRSLVARDFLWLVVRNRDTGTPVSEGLWSGTGQVQADVVDPDTGAIVGRNWFGTGTLVAIDDIPLVSNISVQAVTIRLSQVADRVQDLVRFYEPRQGIVQIFRGLFDIDTNQMVAPAEPRFVGFIDNVSIDTPIENNEGAVTITATSHTQEMIRSNPEYRSSEDQYLRDPNDHFFDDAATVGEWEMFWGKANGKIPSVKDSRGLLDRLRDLPGGTRAI